MAIILLQVNGSGVMPIIFSTSSLALPGTLARFTGLTALKQAAVALNPGGSSKCYNCAFMEKNVNTHNQFSLILTYRCFISSNQHNAHCILQLLLYFSTVRPR